MWCHHWVCRIMAFNSLTASDCSLTLTLDAGILDWILASTASMTLVPCEGHRLMWNRAFKINKKEATNQTK